MSKRRLDVGDAMGTKKVKDEAAGPLSSSGSLKPGLKMNPYNATPYTPRYFELFRKRIALPVWEYQDKFLELLAKHQVKQSLKTYTFFGFLSYFKSGVAKVRPAGHIWPSRVVF